MGLTIPATTKPCRAPTNLSMLYQTEPNPAMTALVRAAGRLAPPCCRLQPITCRAKTLPTTPCLTMPCQTTSGFLRTQRRGPKPSALRSSANNRTTPGLAKLCQNVPSQTVPCRVWTYTTWMPALKRPCLGRQSPNPTNLPASLAISSMSRKLSTSGSN